LAANQLRTCDPVLPLTDLPDAHHLPPLSALFPYTTLFRSLIPPSGTGCVECLAEGGWWFHLRRCAECGHIGCCDSSPSQHARKQDRKSTRLNSSHGSISYVVLCLKKKKPATCSTY